MPFVWWGLLGLFAAALVNRAADCWLSPARLQCGLTHHPKRQWIVWVGMPALYMVLARRIPTPDALSAACLFAAVLVLLAVVDMEQRRVPNVIVLPATVVALILARQDGQLASAAAGAGLALVGFLALFALGRRLYGPGALGLGDVKLATFIGAVVGLERMPEALLLGVMLAGAAAAFLLVTGRIRRGDSLAYGCFLALAALIFVGAGL